MVWAQYQEAGRFKAVTSTPVDEEILILQGWSQIELNMNSEDVFDYMIAIVSGAEVVVSAPPIPVTRTPQPGDKDYDE